MNPPSLDWDEASLGYNAYSILKTAKDEYGTILPVSIRSFNDYKPPLYTYLTTIPVAILGLSEFSTRFISAFFGTLTILVSFFLIKELFPEKSRSFHLLFLLLFSLSPWHIQFSRIAFEVDLALFFYITGIFLFLKGNKNGRLYPLSFLSFVLSLYSYHSPRLIAPIMMLGLSLIYIKEIKNKIYWYFISAVLFIVLIFPIIHELRNSTAARFGSVTLINANEQLGSSIKDIEYDQEKNDLLGMMFHNRRLIYAKEILAGYIDHFNFDFLFLTGDGAGRHHAAGMGMLYWWDLPFILIGFYYLIKKRNKTTLLIMVWFFLSPLPSAVTKATPHAVRSLLYLPTYQMFASLGFIEFLQLIKKRMIYKNIIILVTFLFFIFNLYYYLHMYWVHTPYEEAVSWQYGYKQMVNKVDELEGRYNKVIVSYYWDQPYIYFLFYNKIDPSWYQNNWGGGEIKRDERSFGKYEFRRINWENDSRLRNTLLVGAPKEIPENPDGLITQIKFPDDSVVFRIVGR